MGSASDDLHRGKLTIITREKCAFDRDVILVASMRTANVSEPGAAHNSGRLRILAFALRVVFR